MTSLWRTTATRAVCKMQSVHIMYLHAKMYAKCNHRAKKAERRSREISELCGASDDTAYILCVIM